MSRRVNILFKGFKDIDSDYLDSSSSDEEGRKNNIEGSIPGGMTFAPGSFNFVLLGVQHCDLEN